MAGVGTAKQVLAHTSRREVLAQANTSLRVVLCHVVLAHDACSMYVLRGLRQQRQGGSVGAWLRYTFFFLTGKCLCFIFPISRQMSRRDTTF